MEKVKRFIDGTINTPGCNLSCSYCYLGNDQGKRKKKSFQYSMEVMQKALSVERLGGVSYLAITGDGETLLVNQIFEFVEMLLNEGHYVHITTNGTVSNKIDQMLSRYSQDMLSRLRFHMSLHYVELKRKNLLETFFENVEKIKKAGCSLDVTLTLCDEYIENLAEIQGICTQKMGALPQVTIARKSGNKPEILTRHSEKEYIEFGRTFHSNLFEQQLVLWGKKEKNFCYAGDWSFVLNYTTGKMSRCHANIQGYDIFANPKRKIKFDAVGYNCKSPCCYCSYFQGFGSVPENNLPTVLGLFDRPEANWTNETMTQVLDHKLKETNQEYSFLRQRVNQWKQIPYSMAYAVWSQLKAIIQKRGGGEIR